MNYVHSCNLLALNWKAEQRATLVYLIRDGSVLLIEKLTGHGAGKVNAPGGKVENGETPIECAAREVNEEVGLQIATPKPVGNLRFYDTESKFSLEGFVFIAESFSGELTSTTEAIPFWCCIDEIPYHRMWEDDQFWLPYVLRRENVLGDFLFADDQLLEWTIDRDGKTPHTTV